MRKKFWHGLLAGGLLGGLLGLMSYPNLKPETKGRIVQTNQKFRRAKEGLLEMWHRRARD